MSDKSSDLQIEQVPKTDKLDVSFINRNKYFLFFLKIFTGFALLCVIFVPFFVAIANTEKSNETNTILKLQTCIYEKSPAVSIIDSSDPSYDDLRLGANLRIDYYYPILIINISSITDIQASVVCASQAGIEITAMGGGHSFEGYFGTNGILLQFDQFHNVLSINTKNDSTPFIKIESGMRLGRFYGLFNQALYKSGKSLAEDGLDYVIAGGTCPTVGVTGHVLCGGYGFFGRKIGISADQIISFEVVNAGGELIELNSTYNSGSCSSGFGIVATITFKLHALENGPLITHFSSPYVYGLQQISQVTDWYQTYAPLVAPSEWSVVIYYHNVTMNLKIQATYMGPLTLALNNTLDDLAEGLSGIFTKEQIKGMYKEGSFLDAVEAWTGVETLEDLIATKSLPLIPPLGDRVMERRKSKSILVYNTLSNMTDFVSTIMNLFASDQLDQMEFKSYGGINKIGLYTDFNSPLLRGHLFEIHYGMSFIPDENLQNDLNSLYAADADLVKNINSIGDMIINKFQFTKNAYVGYVDANLNNPGASYFGERNSFYLGSLREKEDPGNVLLSSSSSYLYTEEL